MQKSINVYHMFATLGSDAFITLNSTMNFVNREELQEIVYFWKQANKEIYSLEMNCFNDGNNTFEDTIIVDINSIVGMSHKHTMSESKTIIELCETKDIKRIEMILSGVQTIISLRKKFNLKLSMLTLQEKFLETTLEQLKN